MAANGNLIFQDTNKATFVGANSNVVIDTVNASFGVGVDVNGPTSNLHVVGNAYVTTELSVGGSLSAAKDQNVTSYLGRAAIGYSGGDDQASFAHVDYNTYANYALKQLDGGATHINAPTGKAVSFRINGVEKAELKYNGDFIVDTDTLYVDATNDRVGIGTETPLQTLEVNGSVGINHNGVGGYTFHTSTGALRAGIHSLGGNHLLFKAGANNERMRLLASGELGIGTTNPIAALDIDGGPENDIVPALSIRGGLYSESDLYVLNTYNDSTVGGVGYAAKVIGVNIKNKVETNNTVQIRSNSGGLTCGSAMYFGSDDAISGVFGILTGDGVVGTTLTEKLTVRASGNVGIGDSEPESILHVQSDVQSGAGGPIKKTSATAATSGYNYILNAPRPGTTSAGAVLFINGSTRTDDGNVNKFTIRNDSGSMDIGNRSETLVSVHTSLPETYNAKQKNVDILLNNGSIWMSPYSGRHRDLGTGTGDWSQYIGKHYLGRILSGIEIENKNTNSAGSTGYYSNLLHFRAHDYGIYGGSVGDRTMTIRGDKVGVRTQAPTYTMHVNGSLFYSSGGLNGSDDRIKYNEESITNALDIIDKLTPQKYEKIMTFPSNAKGTWIPTDENWETIKNAEMKPWEGFQYGDEFGFIAQDVRNIPEVSFLVSGSESITRDENISPEEYNELNDEERSNYTQKFIYESNVVTLEEYTSLTLENRENYTELYSKRVETQTPLGLNYQGIFVIAVKAIQELKSENETLKTQLTSVLARLDALENAS